MNRSNYDHYQSLGSRYYCQSTFPPLAEAALLFFHVEFGWECENPAPRNHCWVCQTVTGLPVLARKAAVARVDDEGRPVIQGFTEDYREEGCDLRGPLVCDECRAQEDKLAELAKKIAATAKKPRNFPFRLLDKLRGSE